MDINEEISGAYVLICGQRAGVVVWDKEKNEGTFRYDPNFINKNLPLSPIKMPLSRINYSFPSQDEDEHIAFQELPGLLADSLPDKYGNTIINTWLLSQGRQSDSLNPVEKLCFIGKRGMGALEFEPQNPVTSTRSSKIKIDNMVKLAQEILSERKKFKSKLSRSDEQAIVDILNISSSPGGARAKAIIVYNPKTEEVRSGQAEAPPGFSHWIIKFDGVEEGASRLSKPQGYGKREMAYYKMATDCGIDMMESFLFEEHGRFHFMTKRFDRIENKKIHMQSFSGLRHFPSRKIGGYSYEQIFETIHLLQLPYRDSEQLFRRMIFNVMAKNYDDHTKNFAFLMDEHGTWKLSPAYDLTYSHDPKSFWTKWHSLMVNGKRIDITRQDLLQVASMQNIRHANHIIDEVSDIIKDWEKYAKEQEIDKSDIKKIRKDLMPL